MISVPPTAALARAPAAAMPAKSRTLSCGPSAQAPRALAAPARPGVPRRMVNKSSASMVGVGAALATTTPTSSPSSSPQLPPPPRRSRPAAAVAARAAPADAEATTSPPTPLAPGPDEDAWRPGDPMTPFMEDRARWLERDLPHLFDDVGIDKSGYAEVVAFRDPITSYDSLSGYLFNIAALRRVFSPTFVLLDVRQTAPRDLTTRWAMEMTVAGGGLIPGPLRPKLAFTGTSILTFDGRGKICRHLDTWDSLAREGERAQDYFSVPGFRSVLAQLADVRKPPAESSPEASSALWSPPRQLLRKTATYEVRRYDDLAAIEAPMGSGEDGGGGVTGPGARSAFRALASFITRERIQMTTPVLSDSRAMRFVLGPGDEAEKKARAAAAASASASGGGSNDGADSVAVSKVRGGLYAVASFGGIATDASAARAVEKLRADLAADGVKILEEKDSSSSSSPSSPPFLLAQYNGPVTLPPFRLNEVLVPLDAEAFDLWKV